VHLYRQLLGLQGVRTLMILIFFARIPMSAAGMVLTLHVALGLGRGYGAAGTVGAMATIGMGLGAPLMGRVVDRYGLRRMLLITTLGETAFWLTVRAIPYPFLLVAAFFGGLVVLPAMSIGRQAIAALVPSELRRTAYSLDSVFIELSFMVGPAAVVLLVTLFSTSTALIALACAVFTVGVATLLMNPPVRSEEELADVGERPARREWLTPRLVGVLVVGAGAVFVLSGTEVAMIAQLRGHGELQWTGLVFIVWSAASAVGGLVYGALHRSANQISLMAVLGALTVPIGLLSGAWWLLAVALLPAAALCAPTIAATGERVSNLAPAAVRGVVTGLQSSAFTTGAALGAPVVGFVVDRSSPSWGFAVAGVGGLLIAGAAVLLERRTRALERMTHVPERMTRAEVSG
jgi:MFS family permease